MNQLRAVFAVSAPPARCLLGAAFRAARSRPGCAARHPLWQGAAVHFSERPRAERRAGAVAVNAVRVAIWRTDLPQCERRPGQDFPALGDRVLAMLGFQTAPTRPIRLVEAVHGLTWCKRRCVW